MQPPRRPNRRRRRRRRCQVRDWAFTGRRISSAEAYRAGLVSQVERDPLAVRSAAVAMATAITAKSPLVLLGIKQFLNFTRDHSVDESLEYAITWNMCMLQAADPAIAGLAMMTKSTPEFPDLPMHSKM